LHLFGRQIMYGELFDVLSQTFYITKQALQKRYETQSHNNTFKYLKPPTFFSLPCKGCVAPKRDPLLSFQDRKVLILAFNFMLVGQTTVSEERTTDEV
jgi:hypothetical protein